MTLNTCNQFWVLARVQDLKVNQVKPSWKQTEWKLECAIAKNSQFFLWVQWAPLPPSSCTQSEHQWGTATQSGLCFGVSSGCPVTIRHRDIFFLTLRWFRHHYLFCRCTRREAEKSRNHTLIRGSGLLFNLHQSPLSLPLESLEPMAWESEKSI